MNLADILTLAGLSQQEPTNSLSTPGSSCNQHMNPDDMRTLVIKLEQPQPEQEMVATEEAEGSYANVPDEREVGDTHDDFSFKGFGKRKRHTHDALGNYGDNPLEESKMFTEYENFKKQELKELWGELGNWFKGKGYKSDEELSADEKGSGEKQFTYKKGDVEKGAKAVKKSRLAAIDKSLRPGAEDESRAVTNKRIAAQARDTSWGKDYKTLPQQATQVARQKPYTGPVLRKPEEGPRQVARPVAKPTVKPQTGLSGAHPSQSRPVTAKPQTGLSGAHPSQSRSVGFSKNKKNKPYTGPVLRKSDD